MGDASSGIRIGKSALHHDVKRKLTDDLFARAVFWLLLDQLGQLFLRF